MPRATLFVRRGLACWRLAPGPRCCAWALPLLLGGAATACGPKSCEGSKTPDSAEECRRPENEEPPLSGDPVVSDSEGELAEPE